MNIAIWFLMREIYVLKYKVDIPWETLDQRTDKLWDYLFTAVKYEN
jgi:hypothetical protein